MASQDLKDEVENLRNMLADDDLRVDFSEDPSVSSKIQLRVCAVEGETGAIVNVDVVVPASYPQSYDGFNCGLSVSSKAGSDDKTDLDLEPLKLEIDERIEEGKEFESVVLFELFSAVQEFLQSHVEQEEAKLLNAGAGEKEKDVPKTLTRSLNEIASSRKISLASLVSEIDDKRSTHPKLGLSSAVRIFILEYYKN